jgi:Predicted metal-sulfur cluster biosynthetic enzyme
MIAFSEISSGQIIVAQSEVIGKQVPQGVALHIAKDQEVRVTQALGNSITVDVGSRLARIETEDLAKFGIAPPDALDATEGTLEERIWEVLKQSYDPEIPVNIVELGLIYDLRVSTLIDGRTHVSVDMTLTAPGCGMGPVMTRDIQEKIEALDGVDQASIQLVFDPPWDASRMTEEARLEAGLF